MSFLGLGVATALLYALWVLFVPLLPTNLYVPLLDLGKITGYHWPSALLFLAIVLGLYALYAAACRVAARRQGSFRVVFGFSAFFCAELLLAYPATAVDVFGYIAHGRLLVLHHANPLIVPPSAFRTDPILPYLAFPNEPSQYGPLWILLNGALAWLANGNLLAEVMLYKAVAILAHLSGGAVIYHIARRLTPDRALARTSALVYLWNPLVLWEMVGNAHNDELMMLCGLLAVWLFVTHNDLLVLPALALGALVKVPLISVAPILFSGVWHRSWSRAVEGALLAVVLAAAIYRPFWEGFNTLTALRRSDLFTASLGSVLRLGLTPKLGLVDATAVARSVSLAGFGLVVLIAVLLAFHTRTDRAILELCYATLLGTLLLATTWFQAWYVVWPLAIGSALPEPRRHLEVMLLSLGGLLQYFVFIYLWVMGVFPVGENLIVQGAAYLCIVGPLMLGLAVRDIPRTGYRVATLFARR